MYINTYRNQYKDIKYNYCKTIEKSISITLIIIILLFISYPKYSFKTRINKSTLSIIEVVDIPVFEQIEPPSSSFLEKLEPIKLLQLSEVESTNHNLKFEIKEIDLKLDIKLSDNNTLFFNSQLIDYANVNKKGRSYFYIEDSLADLNLKGTLLAVSNEMNTISLNLYEDKKDKNKYQEKSLNFEVKSGDISNVKIKNSTSEQVGSFERLITLDINQVLLKESESLINTEEYRIWNRINAAFDRLNKDRYGELPSSIKRIPNGLTAVFDYNNNERHDIFWTKGGKVIIRVTKNKSIDQLTELRRAYDNILKIIYQSNS